MLKLNMDEVLRFFDEMPEASRSHASAIVGVIGEDLGTALLQKCLREEHDENTSVVLARSGLPLVPTLGTGRGYRLDRWLLSDLPQHGKRKLYQVEIKNSSAHAIGGRKLSVDLNEQNLAHAQILEEHRRNGWAKQQWDISLDSFRSAKVNKVLTKMNIPVNDGRGNKIDVSNIEVEPIICFWDALHPEGKSDSLFEIPLSSAGRDNGFRRLWVFSMSNFLRRLNKGEIILDMPSATQRIDWLHRLFALDRNRAKEISDLTLN